MAYRPRLTVDVEYEGAVFHFSKAKVDREQAQFAALKTEAERGDALPLQDRIEVKASLARAFMGLFANAVCGWDGYETPEGEPVAFTPEAIAEFPAAGELGQSLIEELQRLGESAAPPQDTPTPSTPPE